MLTEILRWLGAGDAAIATMGPVLAIALAMLGGYGVTQACKFPLSVWLDGEWRRWLTRMVSVASTTVLAVWLGDIVPPLALIVGAVQPAVYGITMAIVRRRWPWLEATILLGSADPSPASVEARAVREAERAPPRLPPDQER